MTIQKMVLHLAFVHTKTMESLCTAIDDCWNWIKKRKIVWIGFYLEWFDFDRISNISHNRRREYLWYKQLLATSVAANGNWRSTWIYHSKSNATWSFVYCSVFGFAPKTDNKIKAIAKKTVATDDECVYNNCAADSMV